MSSNFLPPRVYETQHPISRKICRAFAAGCGGQLVPAVTLLDGDAATYGILRGTSEILHACVKEHRNFWYIDHGYFRASKHATGDFGGFYSVTRNAHQHNGNGEFPPDRWHGLGIEIKPWQRNGRHIVVCPASYNVAVHMRFDAAQWLRDTIAEISRYTDRPIIVKPKSADMTLEEALDDAHCIVGHTTKALADAILMGVPAFNLGESCTHAVALQDLSRIEQPAYPDRRQWAYNLSYQQFTLEEIENGTAWRMLCGTSDIPRWEPRLRGKLK